MHDDSTDDSTDAATDAATEYDQVQLWQPPSSPNTAGRRRWPFALGGLSLVTAAIVVPAYWILSITVPERDHAVATRSLVAAEEAVDRTRASLADSRRQQAATAAALSVVRARSDDLAAERATLAEANTALEAELARAHAEVADLADDRAETRARLEPTFLAARAFGYFTVAWLPEEAQALTTDGLDTSSPDAILASLGQEEAFLDWVELRNAWVQFENALSATQDAELAQHYESYMDSEIGSREEAIALNEMTFRLTELLIGPLMDEAARCVRPAPAAPLRDPLRSSTRDC
jgi:hypothetical protein